MVAIIKGDIISSRKVTDPEQWLLPLKALLSEWGSSPKQWELVWGDFFQLEIEAPQQVLKKALRIKTLIKKNPSLDVKMGIGIGKKSYSGKRISESNGEAFIFAAESFDHLEKEDTTLGIKTSRESFDNEFNRYLKLAGIFMDKWSVASAELMETVLQNPNITQKEMGKQLGIKQSAVSGRWTRANVDAVLDIEKAFHQKINALSL